MEDKKINIGKNINYLRNLNKLTIEELSDKIDVSRQTIGKWESGQSIPDLENIIILADVFEVTIDELIYFDGKTSEISMTPKGKHLFGTTTIEERGQIVIPKKAREMFNLNHGVSVTILGDDDPVMVELQYYRQISF